MHSSSVFVSRRHAELQQQLLAGCATVALLHRYCPYTRRGLGADLLIEMDSFASRCHVPKGLSLFSKVLSLQNKCVLHLLLQGSGRITVPGFYDQVRAMTAADKADVAAFPFSEEAEQEALGVLGFMGEC